MVTGENKKQFEKWYLGFVLKEQGLTDTVMTDNWVKLTTDNVCKAFYLLRLEMQIGVYLAYLREERGVVLSIYNNASGFLWAIAKEKSGTNLGDSWDIKQYHSFKDYNECFKNAMEHLMLKDLKEFEAECKPFHWSNYANFLGKIN
jgi:hypothetical protein